MTFFWQLVVTGLSTGMVYALIALGFVIILKCSGAFNIAQGHFVMLGGYLGYTFLVVFHLDIWLSVLLAVIIAAILGAVIERLALRPLIGQSVLPVIMMTIALASIMEGGATLIWGGEYVTYHGILPTITLTIGTISIPPESIVGLIVSFIVVGILIAMFRFTKRGLAMRATAEDEQVVRSSGVRVTTVYSIAWMIASVVGVVGGILLGSVTGVNPLLAEAGFEAVAVVILGGLDSIGGAIVAGLILGVLKNVSAGYLDPLLPSGGGLANVFPFIVIIVVLIIRPYGLFGLKRIERI